MTAPKAMDRRANQGPFELVYSSGGTGGPYKTEEDAKEGAERRIGGEQWIAIVPARQINDLTKAKYEWLLKRGKKWEKGPRPLPNVAPHAHFFEAMGPEVAFENALLSDRVALRFAKDFSSPEALREYLREHPNADPRKHDVVKEDGQRSFGELKVKVKVPKELSGEIGSVWQRKPAGNPVDRIKNHIDKGEEVSLKVLRSAINILKGEAASVGGDQAKKYKALATKLKSLAQVKD